MSDPIFIRSYPVDTGGRPDGYTTPFRGCIRSAVSGPMERKEETGRHPVPRLSVYGAAAALVENPGKTANRRWLHVGMSVCILRLWLEMQDLAAARRTFRAENHALRQGLRQSDLGKRA
jgi:hypothetical protein